MTADGSGPDRLPVDRTPAPDDALPIPDRLEATLVLVRHGESEMITQGRFQGRSETPLSTRGRRQAELVAQRLARPADRPALPLPARPPLEIVHSPLARAAETAAAIGAAIAGERAFRVDVARRADDRLTEIGQGAWEGRLASEIAATDGAILAAWRQTPTLAWAPGGEPLSDVRRRVVPALRDALAALAAAGSPGSIDSPQVGGYRSNVTEQPWSIVVAHDGVFKVLLLALFDLPLERFWMWTSELCGISIIELRAGRPVARALNLTDHLVSLLDETSQEDAEARARSGAL